MKKFCPVTQRTCDYDLCGWFNPTTNECAVLTISRETKCEPEKKPKSKAASK